MQINPDAMLTYVEQLKENPLAEIEDHPRIPLIAESHFDTAIELSEKYVHKKNGSLTGLLIRNKDRLLEGQELAPCCKTVIELKRLLRRELPRFWKYARHEKMEMIINDAFPIETYRPFFQLQKIVSVLQNPIAIKELMNRSLEAANQVDLNEIKKLIEECKQIKDPILLKEANNAN